GLVVGIGVFGLLSCNWLESEFPDPTQNRGLLNLVPSVRIDTADGARLDTVVATVDMAAAPLGISVAFSTSISSFLPSGTTTTVAADSTGVSRAFIRAPADSAVAIVTASAGGVTRTTAITYVPAPPTWVQVVPKTPILMAGAAHSVDVVATLV